MPAPVHPKITAVIADDEQHLSEYLRTRLAAMWPELDVVGVAKNGLEAIQMLDDHLPTVAFLDIRMPGLTGLEVAARADEKIHVVFVTAYDQYALNAFDTNAVDYLLKPVEDARLARTIEKLKAKLTTNSAPEDVSALIGMLRGAIPDARRVPSQKLRWIRASVGDVVKQIAVSDVLYFQAQDKYVSVYTKEGESLIRTPLSELLAELDGDEFWQIHRSSVVNVGAILSSTRDDAGHTFLLLRDTKAKLQVSRAYAHLFKQM